MTLLTAHVVTRCVTCSAEVGPIRRYCQRCRLALIDRLLDERLSVTDPTAIDRLLTRTIANRREV